MSETEQTDSQPKVADTGGGSYIEGNVQVGRDMAGRDIVHHHYHGVQPNSEASPLNLEELFSKAIRLQIDGKLLEALEVYQQISASNPHYPRVSVEMAAIEAELERGRRLGYINNRGEIVDSILIYAKTSSMLSYFIKYGSYKSMSPTIDLDLIVPILARQTIDSFQRRTPRPQRYRHIYQPSVLPSQRKQARTNFYVVEVNAATELKEQPNKGGQLRSIIPGGAIVVVKVEENKSFVQVSQDQDLWIIVGYGSHNGWIKIGSLEAITKISFSKYYG
jgi:hypothetical protein